MLITLETNSIYTLSNCNPMNFGILLESISTIYSREVVLRKVELFKTLETRGVGEHLWQ